jgi:hypothetical protein
MLSRLFQSYGSLSEDKSSVKESSDENKDFFEDVSSDEQLSESDQKEEQTE